MPSNEDVIRLILDVQGKDKLRDLRAEEKQLVEQLAAGIEALKGHDVATIANHASIQGWAAQLADVRGRIDAERDASKAAAAALRDQASATHQADTATAAMGKTAGISGQGMLQLAYFADDLQYGMRGIVNNIPILLTSLGVGGGLAGVVSIVAVGIGVLGPKLAELGKSLFETEEKARGTTGELGRLRDRIKELEEKKILLPVDTLELDAAKKKLDELTKAQQAFDALQGKQTKMERESGQAIEQAIIETPGGREALAAAKARMTRELVGQDQGLRENREQQKIVEDSIRMAQASGVPMLQKAIPGMQSRLAALQQAGEGLQANAEKSAKAIVGQMEETAFRGTGIAQREAQGRLAGALRGEGAGRLAGKVGGMTPEDMKAKAEEKERAEGVIEDTARELKELKEKQEAEQKERKELNEQGQKFEAEAAKERREALEKDKAAREKEAPELQKARAKQAEERQKELTEGLTGAGSVENLAELGIAQFQATKFPSRKRREEAAAGLRQQIQQSAYQAMLAKGVEPGKAEGLAQQAPAFYQQQFQQKLANAQAATHNNQAAMQQTIAQLIRNQAQIAATNQAQLRHATEVGGRINSPRFP